MCGPLSYVLTPPAAFRPSTQNAEEESPLLLVAWQGEDNSTQVLAFFYRTDVIPPAVRDAVVALAVMVFLPRHEQNPCCALVPPPPMSMRWLSVGRAQLRHKRIESAPLMLAAALAMNTAVAVQTTGHGTADDVIAKLIIMNMKIAWKRIFTLLAHPSNQAGQDFVTAVVAPLCAEDANHNVCVITPVGEPTDPDLTSEMTICQAAVGGAARLVCMAAAVDDAPGNGDAVIELRDRLATMLEARRNDSIASVQNMYEEFVVAYMAAIDPDHFVVTQRVQPRLSPRELALRNLHFLNNAVPAAIQSPFANDAAQDAWEANEMRGLPDGILDVWPSQPRTTNGPLHPTVMSLEEEESFYATPFANRPEMHLTSAPDLRGRVPVVLDDLHPVKRDTTTAVFHPGARDARHYASTAEYPFAWTTMDGCNSRRADEADPPPAEAAAPRRAREEPDVDRLAIEVNVADLLPSPPAPGEAPRLSDLVLSEVELTTYATAKPTRMGGLERDMLYVGKYGMYAMYVLRRPPNFSLREFIHRLSGEQHGFTWRAYGEAHATCGNRRPKVAYGGKDTVPVHTAVRVPTALFVAALQAHGVVTVVLYASGQKMEYHKHKALWKLASDLHAAVPEQLHGFVAEKRLNILVDVAVSTYTVDHALFTAKRVGNTSNVTLYPHSGLAGATKRLLNLTGKHHLVGTFGNFDVARANLAEDDYLHLGGEQGAGGLGRVNKGKVYHVAHHFLAASGRVMKCRLYKTGPHYNMAANSYHSNIKNMADWLVPGHRVELEISCQRLDALDVDRITVAELAARFNITVKVRDLITTAEISASALGLSRELVLQGYIQFVSRSVDRHQRHLFKSTVGLMQIADLCQTGMSATSRVDVLGEFKSTLEASHLNMALGRDIARVVGGFNSRIFEEDGRFGIEVTSMHITPGTAFADLANNLKLYTQQRGADEEPIVQARRLSGRYACTGKDKDDLLGTIISMLLSSMCGDVRRCNIRCWRLFFASSDNHGAVKINPAVPLGLPRTYIVGAPAAGVDDQVAEQPGPQPPQPEDLFQPPLQPEQAAQPDLPADHIQLQHPQGHNLDHEQPQAGELGQQPQQPVQPVHGDFPPPQHGQHLHLMPQPPPNDAHEHSEDAASMLGESRDSTPIPYGQDDDGPQNNDGAGPPPHGDQEFDGDHEREAGSGMGAYRESEDEAGPADEVDHGAAANGDQSWGMQIARKTMTAAASSRARRLADASRELQAKRSRLENETTVVIRQRSERLGRNSEAGLQLQQYLRSLAVDIGQVPPSYLVKMIRSRAHFNLRADNHTQMNNLWLCALMVSCERVAAAARHEHSDPKEYCKILRRVVNWPRPLGILAKSLFSGHARVPMSIEQLLTDSMIHGIQNEVRQEIFKMPVSLRTQTAAGVLR